MCNSSEYNNLNTSCLLWKTHTHSLEFCI
ncbi:hypothetical protein LINGRAHAP2_LOCUS24479 [Linum grandiflorum]